MLWYERRRVSSHESLRARMHQASLYNFPVANMLSKRLEEVGHMIRNSVLAKFHSSTKPGISFLFAELDRLPGEEDLQVTVVMRLFCYTQIQGTS